MIVSNSQWNGPGGPGHPQGGYPEPGHGYGAPAPKRNMTLPIVLAAVVAAVVAGGIVWLVMGTTKPTTTSTPAQTTTVIETPTPSPSETPPQTPTTTPQQTPTDPDPTTPTAPPPAKAPIMPRKVGDLEAFGDPRDYSAHYASADFSRTVGVGHRSYPVEEGIADLEQPHTTIGNWTCGQDLAVGSMTCVAEPVYGGYVFIHGLDKDPKTIVAFGEEFLAAWK